LELADDKFKWLAAHGQLMQDAGDFSKAVEDWKKIDQLSRRTGNPARDHALNGLAYAQALAKVDLEDALANVNKALDAEPDSAAMLDRRGYILHLLGENAKALEDMNRACKQLDKQLPQLQKLREKKDAVPQKSDEVIGQPKTIREAFGGDPF